MTGNMSGNAGQSDLATVAETAARLGKSERTIRRMIASGKLNSVDIGGVSYVQLAGFEVPAHDRHMTGGSVQIPANAGQNDRHMTGTLSRELSDALHDTIRRQDTEIAFLRGELSAIRATLETVTRMLPASSGATDTPTNIGKHRIPSWIWIIVAITILVATSVGGYWLWLTR